MTRRPAFLKDTKTAAKNLRRFYKNKSLPTDIERLSRELASESDRSIVVLLVAHIDDALQTRLTNHFCLDLTKNDINYIFRFEGPLGTFSRRMEMACLFGAIDDELYEQLDILRELRNAFAHSSTALFLSDDVVHNLASKIFYPLGFNMAPSDRKLVRKAFMSECIFILATLSWGSREEATKVLMRLTQEHILSLGEQLPSHDKRK